MNMGIKKPLPMQAPTRACGYYHENIFIIQHSRKNCKREGA